MLARAAGGDVEQARAVLLDARRLEEPAQARAERVGEVEHHRGLLVALESVDRGGDAGGARTETVVKEGLDEACLRGVGGDRTHGVVRVSCWWQEARLGKVKDDVSHQDRVEEVIAGVGADPERGPRVKRGRVHVQKRCIGEGEPAATAVHARIRTQGVVAVEKRVDHSADRFAHPVLGAQRHKMRYRLLARKPFWDAGLLEDVTLEPLFGERLLGHNDRRELAEIACHRD